MWEEEEFRFLKDRFTFSVYDICTTKVSSKEEAFVNPMGSLIEQMDLFEYSSDDINCSICIVDELLNKIAIDKKALSVLGCEVCGDCDAVCEVRCDIHNMFHKLQKNYTDIASSNDDNRRRVEYQRLLKGFRLIVQVLSESLLPLDVIAANIATIRESSKHCMSNWKLTLIGLMINFEPHIENLL